MSNNARIKTCPQCACAAPSAKQTCAHCGHMFYTSRAEPKARTLRAAMAQLTACADDVIKKVFNDNSSHPTAFPGHDHSTPGRWDGTDAICEECLAWSKFVLANERAAKLLKCGKA